MNDNRIYDDPNHPHYGPVRRMWVIFAQLDLFESAEKWGDRHKMNWDIALADLLRENPHVNESQFQQWMLRQVMRAI